MKKYTQIIAVLVVFALLVIAKQSLSGSAQIFLGDGEGERRRVVAPSAIASAVPSPTARATVTTPSTPAATPKATAATTVTTGKYKDGTYTGSVADAYYGYVQVQAVISQGKITDVKFLQHPSDNRTSQSINNQAMPYLTQEAIQAQSAQVNTISGASATSGAFKQSLQSALAQAV